ncbi:hypothetical protein ACHAXR_002994, partial [Thalassiosira sp. AJA248-18]
MVGIGQIAPHISTEVDCESLFSQAGYAADSRRSLTKIRFYERLVITKHRLSRIHCHLPDVKELYIKKWKNNDWDEKEERDALDFLDLEKDIHLSMFPHNAAVFEDEDLHDEEDEYENDDDDSVNIKWGSKSEEKNNKKKG